MREAFGVKNYFYCGYGEAIPKNRRTDMWYVIQTITGKEEELARAVSAYLSPALCEACFTVKRRFIKRLGGEWVTVKEVLFPSYLFLETKEPEQLFYELKKIPEYTRLLGDNDGSFIPLETEEEEFLKKICHREGRDMVAELTDLYLDEKGEIRKADGPLRFFLDKIVRLNLRKRFAVTELTIAGRKQTAVFGIRPRREELQR